MKVKIKWLLSLLISFVVAKTAIAQPQGTEYSKYLKQILENNDHFWIRIHAAEALIENNFRLDIQNVFEDELQKTGVERIGALRVFAQEKQRDSVAYDSLGKEILYEFKKALDQHTHLIALEALGKLGLFNNDEQIIQYARNGNGGIKSMAQWVLSNSGNYEEQSALADLLFSPDSLQFRNAAYALRVMDTISQESYLKLSRKLDILDKRHPFRVFLISALWTHASLGNSESIKKELLAYLNGKYYERNEVYEALSEKASKEDMPIIQLGFQDENQEVRVAASKAYLSQEHYLHSQIGWLDWVILIFYGLLLLALGWYYSRLQKSKEDYFLGGRSVGSFVSGISMYVSFFSAISYLAIAGEVIKHGPLMALIGILGAPIIYIIAIYYLIPFFMNLKIMSAYEILEKPFGNKVRRIASSIFLITRLVWMALLIYLASKAMVVMMGWTEHSIILITITLGIITIIYTSMGGLQAVLISDVIQFFILLFGALLTIGMIAVKFGGFGAIIPTSWSENWTNIEFFSFDPYVRLTIFFALVNNITWWICTTGSDQMAIQRFISTKDLKSARKAFLITQIGQVSIYVVLMIVGLSVMQFYHSSPNLLPTGTDVLIDADFLFPHFIASQFPMGMSGLVIAALFSASMSSLSSGINSTSSVLSTDLIPAFYGSETLKSVRLSSAIIGLVVVLLSLAIPAVPGNIIEVTTKTNGLFIAPLFNLFFMALFVKKAKPFGVVMGSAYGLLAAFTIAFWDILTGLPSWSFLWISIVSLIVSVTTSWVFSILLPSFSRKKAVLCGLLLLLPWVFLYSFLLQ